MPRESKESVWHTIKVALLLCVVCSVLVSTAAVMLRGLQERNKRREMQENVLRVAGLFDESVHTAADVPDLFEEYVQSRIIDLETGEYVDESDQAPIDVSAYDQKKAYKDPLLSTSIPGDQDLANIKRRERYSYVYLVEKEGRLDQVILPIRGYGLWSTLWGFISLDAQTLKEGPENLQVRGITYYEHAETPGLGGEVDNPAWKAEWDGKKVYNEDWDVQLQVLKGEVTEQTPNEQFKVDGLTGATITSRGVSNMLQYWLSEDVFGKYLKRLRERLEKGEKEQPSRLKS